MSLSLSATRTGKTNRSTRGAASMRAKKVRTFKMQKIVRGIMLAFFCIALLCVWHFSLWRPVVDMIDRFFVNQTAHLGFDVDAVMVEGREKLSQKELLKTLNIQKGDPVFAHNVWDLKERLEKMPWVLSASVQRRLPKTFYIKITERAPVAILREKSGDFLVDIEGQVLEKIESFEQNKLPFVAGVGAPEHIKQLFDKLKNWPDIRKKIVGFLLVGERRWNLKMQDGIDVKLPEVEVSSALKVLSLMMKRKQLNPKIVKVLDLRLSSQIVVELRDGVKLRKPEKKIKSV